MSQQENTSQQLQDAFDQFSELSEQLQDSYQGLQDRVTSLTRELYAARSERLKQLTEKEQLAERLGALLGTLPGGVIVLDAQGVICECNPAALQIFRQPLLAKLWQDIIPQQLSDNGDGNDLLLPDARVINISRRPLESNGGCILLVQDVTENRSLQRQVNRQERLTAMGEMTARLAHQLRTPLATALLYASHLNKLETSPKQRLHSSQQLLSGLHHLDQMINDMLVFSHGGSSSDELISLVDLIEQVRVSLTPQLQSVNAEWKVIKDDSPFTLHGNPVSLFGALSNLASNALCASGNNAHLMWQLKRNGNKLQLSLQDNGPGIEQQLGEHIFEPFFTTRNNGTGLGLPVVRTVVEAHGGNVYLDNTNNGGACFVIELPAKGQQNMPSHLQSVAFNNNQTEQSSVR